MRKMERYVSIIVGLIWIIYISGLATQTTEKICWDQKWYNDSVSSGNRSNYEHQSTKVLDSICTHAGRGPPIAAQCRDERKEPFNVLRNDSINHYLATCNPVTGLICHPYNNTNATCPDFAIQYGCRCPKTTSKSPTGTTVSGLPVLKPSESVQTSTKMQPRTSVQQSFSVKPSTTVQSSTSLKQSISVKPSTSGPGNKTVNRPGGSSNPGSTTTVSGTGTMATGKKHGQCGNNSQTCEICNFVLLLCMIILKVFC